MPETARSQSPSYLVVGHVVRPHGVRGDVRVKLLTDYPERLATRKRLFLGADVDSKSVRGYDVERVRLSGDFALLKFAGITTRDQADRLRQLAVMVAIDDAVPLEPGEFYLYQLIGLRVQLEDGAVLGTLADVLETGANDVYIVRGGPHGEVLLPAIESVVLNTDIEAGVMTVRLPEGLLDPLDDSRADDGDA